MRTVNEYLDCKIRGKTDCNVTEVDAGFVLATKFFESSSVRRILKVRGSNVNY